MVTTILVFINARELLLIIQLAKLYDEQELQQLHLGPWRSSTPDWCLSFWFQVGSVSTAEHCDKSNVN